MPNEPYHVWLDGGWKADLASGAELREPARRVGFPPRAGEGARRLGWLGDREPGLRWRVRPEPVKQRLRTG